MLVFIGLLIILSIVVLLILDKVTPVVALVLIPFAGALLAGFSFPEIIKFYNDGTRSVFSVAIVFIFAIIFFGIMNDVGLFQPIIKFFIRITRGNVIAVTVSTVFIAIIAQLDGSGASTFLLVIPPLLPLYKRLKINLYLLFLLVAASAGLINLLPWGGPTGRVASVLKIDVGELYQPLIPIQIIGVVFILLVSVFLGWREQARIRREHGLVTIDAKDLDVYDDQYTDTTLLRPKLFFVNVILFIATLGILLAAVIPSGYVFMIATALALLINFRKTTEQIERVKAHSGGAILMATIILAAGTFLGILKGTGMLSAISQSLTSILPEFVLPYLHIIIGMIGVPLELVLSTDAYYYGLFPIVENITSQYGVSPASSGYALLLGSIIGTFVSPFSPALWLGLGLANLNMGKHIRYSFFWIWGISLATLFTAILIGVV